MIDDESGDTVKPSIVSSNGLVGDMLDGSVDWSIKSIAANNNIEGSFVEGKITDVNGMDLSDGGHREENSDSGRVWIWSSDLNFKGWVFGSGKLLTTNLKPVKVQVIFYFSRAHDLPEWK